MVTPACSSSGNRSGLLGGRGIKATARHSMGQNSLGDPLGFWQENVERMIKERHDKGSLGARCYWKALSRRMLRKRIV